MINRLTNNIDNTPKSRPTNRDLQKVHMKNGSTKAKTMLKDSDTLSYLQYK
jgi:hypothetical protein